MTMCTHRSCLLGAVVLALLCFAQPASADLRAPETLALGWLVENADAVAVVVPIDIRPVADTEGLYEIDVEVEASIRGPLERRTTAVLRLAAVEPPTFELREEHLAFLRALPTEEGEAARWTPVTGALGLRPVASSGPEARFPDLCRQIAAVVDDADRYRALLVRGIEDEDPGIAWSAATDLVRHAEMHGVLTDIERVRIVSAFERQPIGKATKKALALAAAATRHEAAGPALVRSLLHPRAAEIRLEIGVALRRLESADAVLFLVQTLRQAAPGPAANLLNALGTMAPASVSAAEAARGRVLDPAPAVRIEAAHALGLVVRELQRASPAERLQGREEVLEALAKAGSKNEQRTMVWALAQLDEEEAYAALRELADDDERPFVREAAERYLANPRLSLLLE